MRIERSGKVSTDFEIKEVETIQQHCLESLAHISEHIIKAFSLGNRLNSISKEFSAQENMFFFQLFSSDSEF